MSWHSHQKKKRFHRLSKRPINLDVYKRQHLLYFTINEEFQSSNDGYYHSISLDELTKLNRPIRRLALQNAAQYYLDELASSKIYYVTPDKTVQAVSYTHLSSSYPEAVWLYL